MLGAGSAADLPLKRDVPATLCPSLRAYNTDLPNVA
jgi:hypothetical protein